MINSADISGRLPRDAQSSDSLRLDLRQEPGKAPAQQFEGGNMLMTSMNDAALQREPLDGKCIGLAGAMVGQLPRAPGRNGLAENIAATRQAFAVWHHSPQPLACHSREMGKAQKVFIVRLDRGGGTVFETGVHEPWRENG